MKNFYKKLIQATLLTLSFMLSSAAYGQYCVPTYLTGCSWGDDLNDVELQGNTITLSNLNSGCNGDYTDNTTMNAPDLTPGMQYTISVGTSYSSPNFESVKVWIDYDENETFDANEVIAEFSSLSAGLNSFTFEVPVSATPGIKRMRVKLDYTQDATGIDPCVGVSYGETEDYSVDILPLAACSGQPDAGIINGAPTSGVCSDVALNLSLTGATTGGDMTRQWQKREPNGNNVWEDIVGANSFILNLPNGISVETDFRFYIVCDNSTLADTSNIVNFTINDPADCYCEPITSSGCSNGATIDGVSTSGGVVNISNTGTGCSGGYIDYVTTHGATVAEGTSFDITVDVSNYGGYVKVWIDYDQNGVFDASELVAASTTSISSGSSFTETVLVPLGTMNGETRMRVRLVESNSTFTACSTQSYGETEDYKFEVAPAPSCLPPNTLEVSNITSSSADLGWTENNGVSTWNIEYGPTGFGQGNGTTVNGVTSNPYTLTGLTADTDYEFYVQSDCGGGDESAWAGPFAFTTPCNPYSIPYFEGFEAGYTHNTAVGGCLTQESIAGAGVWTANNTLTTYNRTPRTGDWNAFLGYSNTDWMFIPVQLVGGTSYTMDIYARQDGSTAANAKVEISYGASGDAASMTDVIIAETGVVDNQYQLLTGTFTPATSGVYYIGIKGIVNGSPWYLSVDDIAVYETPSCLAPTNLTATATSFTTADLSWTENNGVSTWNIEYGPTGFGQGNGTTVNGVTSNPYTLTGLTAETDYEFYVQSDCGNGDESAWAGPFSFYTGYCTPVYTSTSDYTSSITTVGAVTNISYSASSQPTGGYADETAQVFESYETQTFDINTTYVGGSNTMYIWVDWNNDLIFDASELVSSYSPNTSQTISFTVPAGTAMGDYRMRIRSRYSTTAIDACESTSFGSAVDFTLSIVAPPSCLPVTDIATTSTTFQTSTITWTANNSETSWNISWGNPGYTPGDGDELGTDVSTSTTYQITGLTEDTHYDVYVQADCGGGDESMWAGPYTIFTGYCEVSTTDGDYLSSVVSEDALTDISYSATTQPAGSYANETAQLFRAFPGQTFDMKTSYVGGSNGVNIWIDWDQDLDFDPVTELVASQASSSSDKTFSINVPTGTAPGTYRMRVRGEWGTSANPPACGSVSYGSTIDFNLVVIECTTTPGIDGYAEVCRAEGTIELNDVATLSSTEGTWEFDMNPTLLNGSELNVSSLPAGSYDVLYVVNFPGCIEDTTVATIDVFGPSSAGTGGIISVCAGAPIDLYSALSGNVDMGGDWYDYNGNLLGTSQPTAPSLGASYNYTYITSNGVCDADTAFVEVVVDASPNCTSNIQEEMAVNLSVYPNPTTDVLHIVNPTNIAALKVEVLDMNGRIVLVENSALKNTTEATISLGNLNTGVYTLRVYNEEGQKIFKVVKR